MKVFISWSGERSKHIAKALQSFLQDVIQRLEPFVSENDIGAGQVWATKLKEELAESKFTILCLTPENLKSEWILFEAGAAWKAMDESSVCPYLFNLEKGDVSLPLSQFHMKEAGRQETFELVSAINDALGEKSMSEERLKKSFDRFYQDLKRALDSVPETTEAEAPTRTDAEKLDEILETVRTLARSSVYTEEFLRRQKLLDDSSTLKGDIRHGGIVINGNRYPYTIAPPVEIRSPQQMSLGKEMAETLLGQKLESDNEEDS